jgi:hypothetical protein
VKLAFNTSYVYVLRSEWACQNLLEQPAHTPYYSWSDVKTSELQKLKGYQLAE